MKLSDMLFHKRFKLPMDKQGEQKTPDTRSLRAIDVGVGFNFMKDQTNSLSEKALSYIIYDVLLIDEPTNATNLEDLKARTETTSIRDSNRNLTEDALQEKFRLMIGDAMYSQLFYETWISLRPTVDDLAGIGIEPEDEIKDTDEAE